MTEIKCLTIDELKSALKDMGEKPFRAGQIFKWLHEGVQSFDEMSNLSKELRARLAENFILTVPEVARKQVSRVDGTVKYLWRVQRHRERDLELFLCQCFYFISNSAR